MRLETNKYKINEKTWLLTNSNMFFEEKIQAQIIINETFKNSDGWKLYPKK